MNALFRILLLTFIVCHGGVTAWLILRSPISDDVPRPRKEEPEVDPVVSARFQRLKVGMTLKEAEEFMGPAGRSLSSDINLDYYIWKDKGGWVSVFIEKGRVTDTHVRPAPPE
jgi:hypothetical protein